ncbi:MAG: cell wall metabolism sensor histidine kinase WalK [Oscillospiraceae bacterium]|nr:cell wall metabolism sensor histidine kinase WalK [Oscillospiraceae bacterium]
MLYKSLHFKLVLILVLFIIVIITIIAAVMVNGVFDFYTTNFNNMISQTLNDDMLKDLCECMKNDYFYVDQKQRLMAESGNLGITGRRNLYILDMTGKYLAGTNDELGQSLIKTPNMLAAMDRKPGDRQAFESDYMDYAVYLSSNMYEAQTDGKEIKECIIYIKDTQEEMRDFSWKIFTIIIQVLLIGLAVAVLLSFFLAKAITLPIQNITKGALKLADGDFKRKIDVSSNDEIGTLTFTFNDMAEKLKAMLDQSEELEKSRREFIANVSHELRTPLATIYGAAETISDDRIDEKEKIKILDMILSESERMTRIVKDLLDISKLDNKKMMWQFTEVNIENLVKNIYETMRVEAEKKDQRLSLKSGRNIPVIYADKERIEQVLVNIVSNAMKYTPDGGKIEISLSSDAEKEKVRIIIKDNGIGIPEEDLPHIFDRFYRVEKARSSEAGGTGLGLSITKEIVNAHKGEITVENATGGGGTVVTVILLQNSGETGEL